MFYIFFVEIQIYNLFFLIIFIYPFTDHKISLPASGCVRVAGQQCDKFLTGLDQDLLNFVWLNNLDFGHPILERFPEVRNDDLVSLSTYRK